MNTYRFALLIALAVFFVTPTVHAAENETFSINCRGYQYAVKHNLDGYDIKITKDGKTRSFFLTDIFSFSSPYGGSTISIVAQCQGAKLPFVDVSSGRYGSSHSYGLINPETPTITVEKSILIGYSNWGYPGAGAQGNAIRSLNNVSQTAQVLTAVGGVPVTSAPTLATISYIKDGLRQTANAPVLKPLSTDGLFISTSTGAGYQTADSYYQAYYFDGASVLVNEYKRLGTPGAHFCEQDNVATCRDSLNKWYRFTNGSWQEISEPIFDQLPFADLVWNHIELVSKAAVTEGSNNLNDRSYYEYDTQNRIIRKISPSMWNTTIGSAKITCGDTTYTTYEKQFAKKDYLQNSYTNPVNQYMLEIVRGTSRKAIPLPHDGKNSWSGMELIIKGCAGNRLFAGLSYSYKDPSSTNWKSVVKTLVVDPSDASIQTRNSARAIDDSNSYYNWYKTPQSSVYSWASVSLISKNEDGAITGGTTINAVTKDGRFTTIKPPYFKRLADYPWGSSMQFGLTKAGEVKVDFTEYYEQISPTKYTHYRFNGSTYVEVSTGEYEADRASYYDTIIDTGTDLYIEKDGSRIALKSYFLRDQAVYKSFLLHDFGTSASQLNWYRIGSLEKDGSRNIRYSVTVNGRAQVWNAVVR